MWALRVLPCPPARLAFWSTAPSREQVQLRYQVTAVSHLWHRTGIVRTLLWVVREDTHVTRLESGSPSSSARAAPGTPNRQRSARDTAPVLASRCQTLSLGRQATPARARRHRVPGRLGLTVSRAPQRQGPDLGTAVSSGAVPVHPSSAPSPAESVVGTVPGAGVWAWAPCTFYSGADLLPVRVFYKYVYE